MPGGRPTKMTEMTVKKLEEAFAIGASDGEACFYAGISKETLYTYQDKTPGFLDRKNSLKERPVLLARQSVIKGLQEDSQLALKYLERRKPSEFSLRRELTGPDGQVLQPLLVKFIGANDTKQLN